MTYEQESLRRVLMRNILKKKKITMKQAAAKHGISYTNFSKKLSGSLPFCEEEFLACLSDIDVTFTTSSEPVTQARQILKDVVSALNLHELNKVSSLLEESLANPEQFSLSYAEPYLWIFTFYSKIRKKQWKKALSTLNGGRQYFPFLQPDEQAFMLDMEGYLNLVMDDKARARLLHEQALQAYNGSQFPGYDRIIRYHRLGCDDPDIDPWLAMQECQDLKTEFSLDCNILRMIDVAVIEVYYYICIHQPHQAVRLGQELLAKMDAFQYEGENRLRLLQYIAWALLFERNWIPALEWMERPDFDYEESGNVLCYRVLCWFKLNDWEKAQIEITRCLSHIEKEVDKLFILLVEDYMHDKRATFPRRHQKLLDVLKKTPCAEIESWTAELASDFYSQHGQYEEAWKTLADYFAQKKLVQF